MRLNINGFDKPLNHVGRLFRHLFWLILLVALLAQAPSSANSNSGLILIIDANGQRRPISPLIYGLNEARRDTVEQLGIKLNRWGGNRATRYNWREDATNTAADWFFQNEKSRADRPEQLWKFKDYELFIRDNQNAQTDTLMTIPMIGWVAKDGSANSFSVAKYGRQKSSAPEDEDAGNGLRLDGQPIQNDPKDSGISAGVEFQREWVKQMVAQFGRADKGGARYYSLDNEPCLWHEIHRDAHPQPTSYDEILELSKQYAKMIKEVDPTAQVTGPTSSHYSAYFNSARDGFDNGSDRKAHGGVPFLEWYLQQMRRAEQESGQRLLDLLDVHFYPETRAGKNQGRIVLESEEEGDGEMQAARLRSTRSLWDGGYNDESWIGQPIRLIPYLREIVNKNYPGTKLALSEYRFGPYRAMSSALAQADALGIFGREGVDLAALWNGGETDFIGSQTEYAFRMFRNYDGRGGKFGEVSITALSSQNDTLSVYAALNSTSNELTVIVINKTQEPQRPQFELRNFNGELRDVYRYPGATEKEVARLTQQNLAQVLETGFAPRSITLLKFKRASN